MEAIMQQWLDSYKERFGARIIKNKASIARIRAMTKLSEEQARALSLYCRGHNVSPPVEDVPVPTSRKNPSPDELLLQEDYTYNPLTHTYLTYIPGLPKPLVTSEDTHKAIIRAYSNFSGSPATINEISRTFGWPRDWVIKYLRIHGMTHDREPFSTEEIQDRPDEDLIEDALQQRRAVVHKKIEKAKWADIQKDALRWIHFQDSVLRSLQESLNDKFDLQVPVLDVRRPRKPFALVVTPADLHYGKLGVNGGFDRSKARDLLFRTTQELVTWVTLYGTPEKIILSSLGDWFHVDNDDNTTTAGTKQDVDVTFSQILVEGCELMGTYIQMLRQVAPVLVVNVPGNHDYHATTTLGLFLSALYRKEPDVQVQSPIDRQYVVYGQTLMGFTHGKDEKLVSLGPIMASENRQAWGNTQYRVWFLGHTHHETVVDLHGVQVISLPSLTGNDRWHHQMGYVGHRRALAGFVVDRDRGVINSLSIPV